jgi:oxalate decarboxylase/phosphoglucose isomerase-like protein (cupin superfamily)
MSDYTKINVSDVKDQAPDFGMAEIGEARFARQQLGAEKIGLTYYKINGGKRLGFGHTHSEVEETYVVISGGGRFKVQDDIFDVGLRDVVYVPPNAVREWEAGDGGMEMLAFGGHAEGDAEMKPGWWTD